MTKKEKKAEALRLKAEIEAKHRTPEETAAEKEAARKKYNERRYRKRRGNGPIYTRKFPKEDGPEKL